MNNHTVYVAGPAGHTFHSPDAQGEDVDIPPNYSFCIGKVRLKSNVKYNIRHGDKLWYCFTGFNGVTPTISVFTNFLSNRNFGAPNALRRSNTSCVGLMDSRLYYLIHERYPDNHYWQRAGPRTKQHYRSKIEVKVIENNGAFAAVRGWRRSAYTIDVVAFWR